MPPQAEKCQGVGRSAVRMLINGKALLALALLLNGAVAVFFRPLPSSQPQLPLPEPTPGDLNFPLPGAIGDAALPDLVCRLWGPLGDPSAFASLMKTIEAQGGSVEILETRVAGEPDHLVLIGPVTTPTAMRRLRDELRSQSIPSQLISEALGLADCSAPLTPQDEPSRGREVPHCPEEARFTAALSVGAFADSSAAVAFRSELAALGYRVRVETLDAPRKAYHLRAQSPRDAPAFALPSTPCRADALPAAA